MIETIKSLWKQYKDKRADKKAKKSKYKLYVYFGLPGSGKTTFAAYIASRCAKNKRDCYSNFPLQTCYALNCKEDLGVHHIEESDIIIDEAGIEYNNRDYKTLPKNNIYFFKYHRHYKDNVYVFSQSYDDMDITIRRLAARFYLMRPSMIPGFVVRKEIGRGLGIDENGQIVDKFGFIPWWAGGNKWIWCPPLWKMFDSYSFKVLKDKEFRKWDDMTEGEKLMLQ